jgi:hypothetical protein
MKRMSMKDHTGRPEHFQADTFEGLVEVMFKAAFLPSDSIAAYMQGMADRHKLWNGPMVRTDSAEHFLTDLDACRSIKLETDS